MSTLERIDQTNPQTLVVEAKQQTANRRRETKSTNGKLQKKGA